GGTSTPARDQKAVARARAESKAFAARSRLTTAELIQAARRADRRLPVLTRPRAARDIWVHSPIIKHAAGGQPTAGSGPAQAVAAVMLPASAAPATEAAVP